MSNSLGTLSANVIAQRSLELLLNDYPVIGLIASDFSDQPSQKGAAIVTRIPSLVSAQDWDDTNGYVATGISNTDVSVTLNKFKHATIELSDAEYSSTSRNLTDEAAKQLVPSLGEAVMADIAALFTSGNYNNATTQAVSGATRNTVIVTPNTQLNKRKVNKERFAIFNSDLYGKLWEDESIVKADFKGVGIGSAKLPVVHGVALSEYQDLPTTGNLIGVVGAKDSIVIASRVPSDAGMAGLPAVGRVSVVTDEKSGLSLQVRESYDMQRGRRVITVALIYGVAVGNPVSLQRIKSA